MSKNCIRDREYYRQIGSKGGRATVEKHGRDHMSRIGRRGFAATTARHFDGDRAAHVLWLVDAALFEYWQSTGLGMKTDRDGRPIWGRRRPHPAHGGRLPF